MKSYDDHLKDALGFLGDTPKEKIPSGPLLRPICFFCGGPSSMARQSIQRPKLHNVCGPCAEKDCLDNRQRRGGI